MDTWTVGGRTLHSRLLIGSARYPSPANMREAIQACGAEVITVSLRRENPRERAGQAFWSYVRDLGLHVLPNTAGCESVEEVLTVARMAREIFETDWLKLEVIGDDETLQPDPFLLVRAAEALLAEGFVVWPYMTDDVVLAERLVALGCDVLMPWGAPIGSGQGIRDEARLRRLRQRFPAAALLVDAGIGAPSHAARAMELGCDGVLLNTAIARAADPVGMAVAFRDAVRAGRRGWLAGLMAPLERGEASSPMVGLPFWHQEER
ncbi:MAG: thiazole synthase [Alphaproteobacteria bacterium]|nr:thiazole synthase [Alphaproteobacteria bacterium]